MAEPKELIRIAKS